MDKHEEEQTNSNVSMNSMDNNQGMSTGSDDATSPTSSGDATINFIDHKSQIFGTVGSFDENSLACFGGE